MIKKILKWAYSHNPKMKVSKKEQAFYKQRIREFFEGDRKNQPPVVKMPVSHLGVNGFEFLKFKSHIDITIVLEKPGMLIGANGKIVGKLCKHLSVDGNVKINAVESKLWE